MEIWTKKRVTAVVASFAILAFGASQASAANLLKWTGCGITKKAFMQEAVTAYKAKTGTVISLSGGGATKGIRAANSGAADIGGNCRPGLPAKFAAEEGDIYMTVVAWDALVPIVNKSNPVEGITSQQLKDVMTGKIANWKELGGPDKAIVVVARSGKNSGVGMLARQIVFGDENVNYAKSALLVKSTGPVENKVKSDPLAIGITGISSASKRVKKGESLKVMKVDGNEATVANIGSGAYPTFRPLYLTTKGKPAGDVKKFLDWMVSDEGQAVVEKAGTVSLRQGAGLKGKFKHWKAKDRIVNLDSLP